MKRRLSAVFEEVCWEFDSENDRWVMPLACKTLVVKADIVRDAWSSREVRLILIASLDELMTRHADAKRHIEPIIERLRTCRPEPI